MRIPSTDGVDLAVHDLGGPVPSDNDLGNEARTLLLCHATGFHGRVFAPMAAALTPAFRVYALDFRSHGGSTRPTDGNLTWDAIGADVLAVVDGLDLDSPLAFGHSMGGAALLLAEHARPGTFAAIAVYEPIVFPGDPPHHPDHGSALAVGARKRRGVFDSRDSAYENFAAKPPLSALDPAALQAYVDFGLIDQSDGTVRLACRPEDEAVLYTGGASHAAFAAAPSIDCPVTVARGAHTNLPVEMATLLVARLPRGRLVELPGLLGPTVSAGRLRAASMTLVVVTAWSATACSSDDEAAAAHRRRERPLEPGGCHHRRRERRRHLAQGAVVGPGVEARKDGEPMPIRLGSACPAESRSAGAGLSR